MRRIALAALAAVLTFAGPAPLRADDPAPSAPGPSATAPAPPPKSTSYAVPKTPKEVEQVIGDGGDTKAMHQAIESLAAAPAAAAPGPPGTTDAGSAFNLDTLREQVKTIDDARAAAHAKLEEAETARSPQEAARLVEEAGKLAVSAAALSEHLMPRERAAPQAKGCAAIGDCALLQRLGAMGAIPTPEGFDTGIGTVKPAAAGLGDHPGTGTDFFGAGRGASQAAAGSPGPAASGAPEAADSTGLHRSLEAAERQLQEDRRAGRTGAADALAPRIDTWRQLLQSVDQMRAFARQKLAEAAKADNPAMAAVLRDEAATQMETADRLMRQLTAEMPAAPAHEPGGIKFEGQTAEGLALALDVTGIEFDPEHGRLVLIGRKSSEAFDLDVFADVLRLAVERHDPFFSLEPRSATDWDFEPARVARRLARQIGTPREIAQRIRAVSGPPIRRGDVDYYYAAVSRVDPEAAEDPGHDDLVNLVFSPDWLRYSKLGWILYRADLAIKAVASGFLDRDNVIVPAASWGFDDFDPLWLHSDLGAGRANFSLDHATVTASATRIDLTDVRPTLYATGRTPGTADDTTPSDYDRAMSAHFSRHWAEYVARVPELAQLERVFRAYVGARYLVRLHPGLAARILAMPREADTGIAPLAVRRAMVMKAAFRRGQPVPLDAAGRFLYDISGGYSGGVDFGAFDEGASPGRIGVDTVDDTALPAQFGWADEASAGAKSDWRAEGDRASASLELVATTVPRAWPATAAGGALATVLLMGVGAVALRRLPWQRLADRTVCAHCTRRHRVLGAIALAGDCVAVSSLALLGTLPFLAAAHESPPDAATLALCLLVAIGGAAALLLFGGLLRIVPMLARLSDGERFEPVSDLLRGGRGLMILVATAAAFGLDRWLGAGYAQLAERVMMDFGGSAAPHVAWRIGAAGAAVAVAASWAAPFLVGTRPVALLKTAAHPRNHDRTMKHA